MLYLRTLNRSRVALGKYVLESQPDETEKNILYQVYSMYTCASIVHGTVEPSMNGSTRKSTAET